MCSHLPPNELEKYITVLLHAIEKVLGIWHVLIMALYICYMQ